MSNALVPPLEPGQLVAELRVTPNNLDAFLFSVTMWATHRIHYDMEWAREEGYDDVLVIGAQIYTWIERLVVDWCGSPSAVRKYSFRHDGFPIVKQELVLTLTVDSVADTEMGGRRVTLAARVERSSGGAVLSGSVEVELDPPSSAVKGSGSVDDH